MLFNLFPLRVLAKMYHLSKHRPVIKCEQRVNTGEQAKQHKLKAYNL